MKILVLRWLKFNFVGAIGIVIQLGCLAILKDLPWKFSSTALQQ